MSWFTDKARGWHWRSTLAELGLASTDTPEFAGVSLSSPSTLRLRPTLVQTTAKASGTPTEVSRGLCVGYSLPIGGANEWLNWRLIVPGRWDGVTDPQLELVVSLSAAEDVGDNFKFSLSWQTTRAGEVLGTTTSVCYSEQAVLTDRAAQYDIYTLYFTLDASNADNPIAAGDSMHARLVREDATDPDVSNEIIVWDWSSLWPVDKMYGSAWSARSNDT